MKYGWEDVLRYWSEAVPYQYEVVELADGTGSRRAGEWWVEDGCWQLQLDEHHFARFAPAAPTPAVRTALTWTLQLARKAVEQSWRERLKEWLEYLLLQGAANGETGRISPPVRLDELAPLARLVPGYFVWVHPRTPLPKSGAADLERGIEQVIRAILPKGWVGWLPPNQVLDHPSFLLFYSSVCPPKLPQRHSAGEVDEYSDQYAEVLQVHQDVAAILTQLESDAFFSGHAVVSRKVEAMSELPQGLASLVTTWRARAVSAQPDRITSFATTPVEHLLSHVSSEGARLFAEIAALRGKTGDVVLTPELLETLQGIVAGNLNVSEAARLLYLHRNTLLNRIEKIRQQTGYDVRNFRDAVILWLLQYVHEATGDHEASP
jgi:hypothetical protein